MSGSFLLDAGFWDATVRAATPIAFAALATLLCSRAGVLFIGVEGVLLFATFFAIAGAKWLDSTPAGVVTAVLAGVGASLLSGFLAMRLRMGDVVSGLVLLVGSLGLTAFMLQQWFPDGAIVESGTLDAPWPAVGEGLLDLLLHQQPLVYVAIGAAVGLAWFLRTRRGLLVRCSGESIAVARAEGIDLPRLRYAVLAVAGALTGLGGATLGLANVGTFDPNIVNGRGFLGLACVVVAGWRPVGALVAAAAFGVGYALQFEITAAGDWAQLTPYVVTLVAIAVFWRAQAGPAEEGRDLF